MSWFGVWMGVALSLLLFFSTAVFVAFVVFSLVLGFVLFASSS